MAHRTSRSISLLILLSASATCATPPALQISNEQAPAGGWAQIKLFAAKPAAIANGRLVVSLDPTVFGAGAVVGLFGANGDALGSATITSSQVDIQFSSLSSGIGQLAGLPVAVISVPVLASASGRTVAVTATSPDSSLSVASGSLIVQGSLSVGRIPAGIGIAPAGTVLPVTGTGFTPATAVNIDGVAIASTQFVSPREVDITLAGAAELVGKRARVTDGSAAFDYFCFQPNKPVPPASPLQDELANVQPLFPLFASTELAGGVFQLGGIVALQNPNTSAADVSLTNTPVCCGPPSSGPAASMTIQAGSWGWFFSRRSTFFLSSTLPVRAVLISLCAPISSVCPSGASPYDAGTLGPFPPVVTPSSLAFTWQKGGATPGARTVLAGQSSLAVITMTPATTSGGPWLSVSAGKGSSAGYTFTVMVDPSQLDIGTYQGIIQVNQSYGPPAQLPVTLTVTAAAVPQISASPSVLNFTATTFNSPPVSQTVSVASDSGPAPFSITLAPGSWLKVSPMSGTTPATLTVTWDPSVTSQIYYQYRSTPGTILISGPRNEVAIPASFNVTGVQTFQTFLGQSGSGPNGLVFSAQTGSTVPAQNINVDPAGAMTITADQPWLMAVSSTNAMVSVAVNTATLSPGVYLGTVTITEDGLPPIGVPVTLGVWSTAPPLTIDTGSFTIVRTVGEPPPPYQTAIVDSGGVPVPLSISIGADWLNVIDHYSAPTPAQILVGVVNPPQTPGEYHGSFTVQAPGGSVYVPVTLLVEPGPVAPPVISQVVNAASGIAGGVSPGEIVSIRGYAVGSAAVGGLRIEPSGLLGTQLNGFQVTFDSTPAPLIYTSANQTNLIVPYEVASRTSTLMQISRTRASGNVQTSSWVLPVVSTAPGVFTIDATGTGQAAVVNADGTVNSAANAAPRGSVISIYATGEGQTSPAGVTGSIAQSSATHPVQPVTVTIGGTDAIVQYAGAAPGEVAGLLQINALVPAGVTPGPSVPLELSVGGVPSQSSVTISVK